ncbi:hypothetical protein BJ875DRAFT_543172 [Amylocarpus encephaloides]|uniref:Zn(2)-C6 fungal-type domain-containing protein n=1 Tax=Amylocarpus encephaloides TaxID=45428 RepID=A0A9P7YI93_9HELO|nr:hypothetical protein BJ875DRAFT_543172 [Amylocarpus encephaloides]
MAETIVKVRKKRNVISRSKNGCTIYKTRRLKYREEKPGCIRCKKAGWTCEYASRISTQPILLDRKELDNTISTQPIQLDRRELDNPISTQPIQLDRKELDNPISTQPIQFNRKELDDPISTQPIQLDRKELDNPISTQPIQLDRKELDDPISTQPIQFNRKELDDPISTQPILLDRKELDNPISTQPIQLDRKESDYFQEFLNHKTFSMTRSDPFFWKRAAVKESHSTPCIWHTLVALGALIKSTRMSFLGTYKMHPGESAHRQFAVEQHDKAICALQKAISSQDPSNSIIISCLVLVPLESFLGSFISSGGFIQHVGYVRNVLFEVSNKGQRSLFPASGLQDFSKEPIMRLFFQQALGILSADEDHSMGLVEQQAPNFSVPTSFKDIQEAEQYRKLLLQHGNNFWYWVSLAQLGSSVPQSTRDLRDHFVNQIHAFNSALDMLVRAETENQTCHPLQRPSALKFQLVTLLVNLSLTLNSPETTADLLIQCFEYIVSLYQEIMNYESAFFLGQDVFLFECRVVGPLFLTATKCRDRSLRQKAIFLLRYSHRREMMCDSLIIGDLANWIMKVEDEGMDMTGFIPDEHRV